MLDDKLQAALAYIQKLPDGEYSSLREHLSSLVVRLLETRGDEVNLAQVSALLKREALPKIESDPLVPYRHEQDNSLTKQALSLFGDRETRIDTLTGMPIRVKEPNEYHVHDCDNMARARAMLEAVGTSLDARELFGIELQLKKLGQDPRLKLKTVRFFGKFFGIFADYYVFEGTMKEPAAPKPETAEEKAAREAQREYPMEQSSGTNAYTYFVCNRLGELQMTKLADVRPEHIRGARTLKRFLTGVLTSRVSTFPPFPWDEAVFLRAQIARIAASTVLSPAGWFAQEEDDDGNPFVARAEETEPLGMPEGEPEEWLANWVHRYEHIKRQGRCVAKPIRELEEDAEEEIELTADETEEAPEGGQVLAPVSEDAKVYGAAAWSPIFSSSSKFAKGQTMGVRSNLWPGAVAVTHGLDFANVYVGWGQKNAPYVPPPPPPIMEEYDQTQLQSVDLPVKPDPDAAPPAAEEGAEE